MIFACVFETVAWNKYSRSIDDGCLVSNLRQEGDTVNWSGRGEGQAIKELPKVSQVDDFIDNLSFWKMGL